MKSSNNNPIKLYKYETILRDEFSKINSCIVKLYNEIRIKNLLNESDLNYVENIFKEFNQLSDYFLILERKYYLSNYLKDIDIMNISNNEIENYYHKIKY